MKGPYRGLKKNTAQLKALFAPSDLWMVMSKVHAWGISAPAACQIAAQPAEIWCSLRSGGNLQAPASGNRCKSNGAHESQLTSTVNLIPAHRR